MNKTISSTDAKLDWNAIISAASSGDDVIVEVHGRPKTVMISFEAYQQVQVVREQQRRTKAVERLTALQRRQAERNSDLTEDEIEEIAICVGREVNAAVAKKWRASLEAKRSQ